MSEKVGKRIEELYTDICRFGKENKTEAEVAEFKTDMKKQLLEIKQNLVGLLKELQELLPPELTRGHVKALHFSCYDVSCVLTRYGVEDTRQPCNFETIEYLAVRYMYPDLKKYRNEHHPSLGGARFLFQRISQAETFLGIRLQGKYLPDNCIK